MIDNRPVELSMLPDHVGASPGIMHSLRRDFRRLRALEHPHIARLLDLGRYGAQYYVVHERFDGATLREVLAQVAPERIEAWEADDVVRAIGTALAYAHSRGVAHGDLRAENVLVTLDRRFLLSGFLARRTARIGARTPDKGEDLQGLARLAAELYTGTRSIRALRSGAWGSVPPARLRAVRAVLEPGHRAVSSVAEFLDLAGLSPRHRGNPGAPRKRRDFHWRVALPVVAVAMLGSGLATYQSGLWRLDDARDTAARDAARDALPPAASIPQAPDEGPTVAERDEIKPPLAEGHGSQDTAPLGDEPGRPQSVTASTALATMRGDD